MFAGTKIPRGFLSLEVNLVNLLPPAVRRAPRVLCEHPRQINLFPVFPNYFNTEIRKRVETGWNMREKLDLLFIPESETEG